jgi:hypothetical protein
MPKGAMQDWVPDVLWEIQSRILTHFGLSEDQQAFAYLLHLGGHRKNYDRVPVLVPKHIPFIGKFGRRLQAAANNRKDNLGFGQIECVFQLPLLISTSSTTKAIAKAINQLKRECGINLLRLDRSARHPPTYLRNLFVLALSEEKPRWSVDEIDVQLTYFGLPKISNRTPKKRNGRRGIRLTRDLKATRRDIARKTKKWILSIARSPLFGPLRIGLPIFLGSTPGSGRCSPPRLGP